MGYSFEDLEVYTVAREFRKHTYALARELPDIERYELAPQVRDAARSMTNNIAEGHGRFHFRDQLRFLRISRGSCQELIDDINICIDEGYADIAHLETLKKEGFEVIHKINSYGAYLQREAQKTKQASDKPE